jgi:hypothetical protein
VLKHPFFAPCADHGKRVEASIGKAMLNIDGLMQDRFPRVLPVDEPPLETKKAYFVDHMIFFEQKRRAAQEKASAPATASTVAVAAVAAVAAAASAASAVAASATAASGAHATVATAASNQHQDASPMSP